MATVLAPPGLDALLASLADQGKLVHVERLAPRGARAGRLALPLRSDVLHGVPNAELWSHQAAAIDLARAGISVAVATGTASGKSLCFQVPIAEAITDPIHPGTALALFPTKALAHDQLRALADLAVPGVLPAAYDGDCSPEERTWARRNANVVLTNPEMLHCGLLPHHARWATFFMRLRYIVVDELHAFRGIFGTHVAHLLRRLRRIAAHYGANPALITCSATIGAPEELASALWGGPVTPITDDGSPRGERLIALWNPAAVEEADGWRGSAHRDTAALVTELVQAGHRTIAFCRSRRGTEVVAADARRRLPRELARTVRSYRGGYLPAERREIEGELFGGRLRGVVTTTALELGVDIGGLDACVLDGFPGTIASMWQQLGRAGRDQQQSLGIVVAGDDALDQWLMRHPDDAFTRPPEPAVINPANPFVLHPHLACAAFELPLTPADERWWPDLLDDGVRSLVLDDRLKVRPARSRRRPATAVWAGRGFPAHGIGLRSSAAGEYRIERADRSLVGTVDGGRAFEQIHPGAVYLHQGCTYRVDTLDLDEQIAVVEPCDDDEYTVARSDTTMRVLGVDATVPVGRFDLAVALHLGPIEVASQVVGYQRKDARSREVLGTEAVDLPASRLITRGFWYTVDEQVLRAAGIDEPHWAGVLHAVEHAAIGILPLFTICDRWDVGGVSTARQADTGRPTIVIYDGYAGGAGIAELGFGAADRHLLATFEVLDGCRCADGCPSCVQSPKCGCWNEPLDKAGARA
ncbi:MAG: box helicase protein, partial [Acidimicrobiaceae bacterium]